ncbi:nuclear transport factor 2 family protein [Sphaerisporangium corydalis]|uniref:Nuclear transport factor 2 family protein n=1 Tax=Sphaerisporangium corydalis TaxID=1441875 RepID=A0ABV9EBU7_9ACTN|nr:nuclear transport factor 2 family protein [Sphaerisporangium corydalis]
MSEHPNVNPARESYDAIAKGDLDHIRDNLLADDVVFHVPGRGSLAGVHTGKADVLSYLAKLSDQTGSSLRYEPDVYLADDEHVAVMLRIRGNHDGKILDERGVHVFTIAGGKITGRWSFPQDSYVIDEFFS